MLIVLVFFSGSTNYYIRAMHKTRVLTSLGRYPKGMWSETWETRHDSLLCNRYLYHFEQVI